MKIDKYIKWYFQKYLKAYVARSKMFTKNKDKKCIPWWLSKIRKRLYDRRKCKLTPAVYCNTRV